VKPILEQARRRFAVAAAEVSHQDRWQRSTLALAVVASSTAHALEVLGNVERFVCSRPDVEVIDSVTRWLDDDP
jgi:uncharacterized protein YlxP (DUF503 family)